MKLIIDIPDNDYRHIKEYYEKNDIVEATYSYIYHGTPIPDNASNGDVLDKIRAEIEQITDTMGVSYNQYVSKIDVLQIIDKYMK